MSLKYHPDKNKGDKYFDERFKDIKEAYDVLSNIESRRSYDYQWLHYYRAKNHQERENQKHQTNETDTQDTINVNQGKDHFKKLPNPKTKPNKWINIYAIIVTIICIALVYSLKEKTRELSEVWSENQRIEDMKHEAQLQNESYLLQIEKLESDLNKRTLAELKAKQEKQTKTSYVDAYTPPIIKVPEGSVRFPNNTFIVNQEYFVEITSLTWNKHYDSELEKHVGKEIVRMSVLNRTSSSIYGIKITIEIISSTGINIDSGEIILYKEKHNRIPPNSAKIMEPSSFLHYDWYSTLQINKNDSDYMILTIRDFKY